MKRTKLSKRASKRMFRHGNKVKNSNRTMPMRGGIRL